jgi:hypothetical protein
MRIQSFPNENMTIERRFGKDEDWAIGRAMNEKIIAVARKIW